MSLAIAFKAEINRLSARTARKLLSPVRRSTASQRRQIAALRRQVLALQKELKLQRFASKRLTHKGVRDAKQIRFVAKGLVSLRKRLGLSAADFGRLINVSGQSVYAWESKKAVPRRSQIAAIAEIRNIGKREAEARLELMSRTRH